MDKKYPIKILNSYGFTKPRLLKNIDIEINSMIYEYYPEEGIQLNKQLFLILFF